MRDLISTGLAGDHVPNPNHWMLSTGAVAPSDGQTRLAANAAADGKCSAVTCGTHAAIDAFQTSTINSLIRGRPPPVTSAKPAPPHRPKQTRCQDRV